MNKETLNHIKKKKVSQYYFWSVFQNLHSRLMHLFIVFLFAYSVHSDRFASHLQEGTLACMRLKGYQICGWQVGMQRARQTGATGCVTLKGADRLERMH